MIVGDDSDFPDGLASGPLTESPSGYEYCPWSGGFCDCSRFPYLVDNLIPAKCEQLLLDGSISMVPIRKVTEGAKLAYKAWVIEEAAKREAEKEARKANHTA